MSTMKWTDEAIERELKAIEILTVINGKPAEDDSSRGLMRFRSALLELKRVRAWAALGIAIGAPQDQREALCKILSGNHAPTAEQENKR